MSSTGERPPLLTWSKDAWARWSSMPRMSSGPIPRTKFLLLKAPVSSLYEEKFGGDRNMFTVSMYAARMMAKRVQVGCVVDCTALDLKSFEALPIPPTQTTGADTGTDKGGALRYFHDTSEWDDFDIDYHRLVPLALPAGGASSASSAVPPAEAVFERFLSICSKHWSSRPGAHVALFDSRGGYGVASFLAARYMCEKMRAPVHVALASLKEAAKPCGLADVDLVKDLQVRYKGRRDVRVENVPAWWWPVEDDDEDDDDEDEGGANGDKADSKSKKRKDELVVVIPPFDKFEGGTIDASNGGTDGSPVKKKPRLAEESTSQQQPDVPGLQALPADSPKTDRAITVVRQLTSQPCSEALPICPDVTVTSTSLPSVLANARYKVTWRSRGRRGFLLILTEGVYFLESGVDNRIAVSIVKGGMRFPVPTVPTDLSQTQHRTLLDGVLVMDMEGGTAVPRYYASDILCHTGGILTSKSFGQRLKYLLDGVIMPRKRDTQHDYGRETIKIRAKEYFDLGRLDFVIRNVMRGVAHGTDGIVLVPLDGKYFSGEDGDKVVVWEKQSGAVTEEELIRHVSTLK